MQLYDAMSTLRAVRRLRTDPIPDEVMERVLQAACWAPTGGNMQPWKVIVVTDPCLLYTSPSPRDLSTSRMPSSA